MSRNPYQVAPSADFSASTSSTENPELITLKKIFTDKGHEIGSHYNRNGINYSGMGLIIL